MKFLNGIKLTLAFAIAFSSALFAQDDMEDAESNAGNCKPASLETPYDKFKQDDLDPQQVNIWYSLAYENFKHEQWAKAVPYYWKVMVNDQSGRLEKVTYSKIAESYINIGKTAEDSRSYLDSTLLVVYRGLEKYPDNVTLHFRAGTLQRSLGRSECAIPHYQALAQSNPEEVSYLKALVDLYLDTNDERAIEAQQKVTELDPSAEEQIKLQNIYINFGLNPMEAIVNAFKQDSSNIKTAISLTTEALKQGDYKLALRGANAALKIEPGNIVALDGQAKAYEGLGRMNDAIASYRKITEVEPANLNAYCALGLAYASVNNFAAAKSQVNKAISLDSQNGLPYMTLGQIIEEAVDYCSNKRGKNEYEYDDNLVFEIAAREYSKAKRDPNYAARADSRINALKPFFRTQEQKFMSQDRTTIRDNCYNSWLSY